METNVRQDHAASIVRDLVSKAKDESRSEEQRKKIADIAGKYAFALYFDISETAGKPIVSAEMESRRGVPDDPGYFEDLDAIGEFLNCLGALANRGRRRRPESTGAGIAPLTSRSANPPAHGLHLLIQSANRCTSQISERESE